MSKIPQYLKLKPVHQALVLCPRCVPETVGTNEKGIYQEYSHNKLWNR
jgi:hypothetical protein